MNPNPFAIHKLSLATLALWVSASLFVLIAVLGTVQSIRARGHLPSIDGEVFEQIEFSARDDRHALQLYQQYLAAVPWDTFKWVQLANLQQKLGQWDAAYESLGQYLRYRAPTPAAVHLQRGLCALQAGQKDTSRKDEWFNRAHVSFSTAKQLGAALPPVVQLFLQGSIAGWGRAGGAQ